MSLINSYLFSDILDGFKLNWISIHSNKNICAILSRKKNVPQEITVKNSKLYHLLKYIQMERGLIKCRI